MFPGGYLYTCEVLWETLDLKLTICFLYSKLRFVRFIVFLFQQYASKAGWCSWRVFLKHSNNRYCTTFCYGLYGFLQRILLSHDKLVFERALIYLTFFFLGRSLKSSLRRLNRWYSETWYTSLTESDGWHSFPNCSELVLRCLLEKN